MNIDPTDLEFQILAQCVLAMNYLSFFVFAEFFTFGCICTKVLNTIFPLQLATQTA